MKKLLGILVLGLLLSSNAKAVPKWIDSNIISICKVKQDITLNMNWLLDDGKWELELIYLTKGDYLSVHKKKKNNEKYYNFFIGKKNLGNFFISLSNNPCKKIDLA